MKRSALKTKLLHPAIAILIGLCAVEFITFIFFHVFHTRFSFLNTNRYTVSRADIPKLKQEYDFSLGWKKCFPTPYGERPRGAEYNRPLLAAFGDSFTYCDQVGDLQTWEEQLGGQLSADIYNFGGDGYGTDQAYIRFQQDSQKVLAPIVTLGLITENIN